MTLYESPTVEFKSWNMEVMGLRLGFPPLFWDWGLEDGDVPTFGLTVRGVPTLFGVSATGPLIDFCKGLLSILCWNQVCGCGPMWSVISGKRLFAICSASKGVACRPPCGLVCV